MEVDVGIRGCLVGRGRGDLRERDVDHLGRTRDGAPAGVFFARGVGVVGRWDKDCQTRWQVKE